MTQENFYFSSVHLYYREIVGFDSPYFGSNETKVVIKSELVLKFDYCISICKRILVVLHSLGLSTLRWSTSTRDESRQG